MHIKTNTDYNLIGQQMEVLMNGISSDIMEATEEKKTSHGKLVH